MINNKFFNELLTKYNLKQREVARMLECHESTISYYKKLKRRMPFLKLEKFIFTLKRELNRADMDLIDDLSKLYKLNLKNKKGSK